ncbi:MAG: hypothetical protein KKF30_03450 [Proteobacteria bacterium]|nr:hypothetical protein [Pseudomonadota bacterium]MBU4471156.1 hypothetical protein [Pseudomonadota bacterium]MCG2751829.1 hypothetical protein [Desulfobacteraceae bacterium]
MAQSESIDFLNKVLPLFSADENDFAEALLGFSDKIQCLGSLISDLGWEACNKGTQTLETHGEGLGNIICDYSRVSKKIVEDIVLPLVRGKYDIMCNVKKAS